MGYCGLKIVGHSETDFKHKKVFAKSQKILNHKPIFTNIRIEQREQTPNYLWYNRIRNTIVIVFIFTVITLLFSYGTRINNMSLHNDQVPSKIIDSYKTKEKQEAAIMLYNSAKLYYNSGALNYAQDEITLVLNLYPTNIKALQLMHNILDKQCETKNKNCKHAEEYRQYLALN